MGPQDLARFGLGPDQARAVRLVAAERRALHEGLRELDALCPGRRFGELALVARALALSDRFDPRGGELLEWMERAARREALAFAAARAEGRE